MRPVSIQQIGPPNIHRLGAAKNRRAPARAGETTGVRERGRPRPHQRDDRPYDPFGSRKSGARTFTGLGCPNNVPVPIWPHSISPLILVVSHALPRMQWALVGAKRFGVRQLAAALFLCPNNVPVPISHIPHQPYDRSCDPFRSRKSGHRTFTGWVRRRIAALLHALEKPPAIGSAAVPGRINPTTRPTTCFDPENRATEHSPVGCGEESPALLHAVEKATASGARPSPAASSRQPIQPIPLKAFCPRSGTARKTSNVIATRPCRNAG